MNEPLASHEKCLVLGSTGYSGIASIGWNDGYLPNIVDYDVVVVDVQALSNTTLASVSKERFKHLRTQFTRLLLSEGRIIVVSDFTRVQERPNEKPRTVNNYSWCPINIGIVKESGESRIEKEDRFPSYLKHLARWPYYFFLPENCLSQEFKKFFGYRYGTFDITPTAYIANRYKKLIAGSLILEKIEYMEDIPLRKYSGEIVLLPRIKKLGHKKAVRLVLKDLTGEQPGDAPPEWVKTVSVPNVTEVEEEIQTREKQIVLLREEIKKLNDERNSLNSILKLLYASGHELEEIVQFCFEKLGAVVNPAQYAEEDFVLQYDGIEYLFEVKGVSKSISLKHVLQLYKYMLDYLRDKGQPCKGILFGNAWNKLPPNERNIKDIANFPDNVVENATDWNIALVSSTKFFEVYCQFMKDESKAPLIMKEILNHNGIIGFESLT